MKKIKRRDGEMERWREMEVPIPERASGKRSYLYATKSRTNGCSFKIQIEVTFFMKRAGLCLTEY